MLYVTTETITGKKFEELGIAMGNTIQSVHVGKDIMNSFKTLVGGELTSYNEMMTTAREIAVKRMLEDASRMGADAVVAMRFVTNSIAAGAAEILAFGTAVKFID
ncbi:MAG: heavy metal-binding domain-containing protein [Blautia sp.]